MQKSAISCHLWEIIPTKKILRKSALSSLIVGSQAIFLQNKNGGENGIRTRGSRFQPHQFSKLAH